MQKHEEPSLSENKIKSEKVSHQTPNLKSNTTKTDEVEAINVAESGLHPQPTPVDQPKPLALAIITLSLALGTFLIALDTLIIGTAVPSITTAFHSLEDIAWYGSSYLLTITALQPSFGKLYKFFGIKSIYLGCIATFEGMVTNRKKEEANC